MNFPDRSQGKPHLTGQVLADALDLLSRLSSAGRDEKEQMWTSFQAGHPTLAAHLIPTSNGNRVVQDYELIFEQADGDVIVQFCPDRGIPWLARYLEDMADNILVMVGQDHITFQTAFHYLRLRGDLEKFLDELIDAAVLTQFASEIGISWEEDEVRAEIDLYRRAHGLLTVEATRVWLEKNNMTVEDLQDYIVRRLIYDKTLRHVTEDEIEPYFHSRRAELDVVLVAHIVVKESHVATAVLNAVEHAPESWASLALQYSMDRDTADSGGWLGLVSRSDFLPHVADTVFSASPGSVVGPFKVEDGLEIIRIYDVRRAQLDDRTREKIRGKIFRDWLAEQREKVDLHWYWQHGNESSEVGVTP